MGLIFLVWISPSISTLSWLSNSALVYAPKWRGRGGGGAESQPETTAVQRRPNAWGGDGFGVSANEYNCTEDPKCGGGCGVSVNEYLQLYAGAQINFWESYSIFNLWVSHLLILNKPTYKNVVHLEVCLFAGGLIVELHEGVLQGVPRLLVPNHLAVLHLSKPARTSTVRCHVW